ncbi:hypothetical protein DRE_01262 [Drechslerella stenobrocha 248]|uniref:Uncharacterized protein n=1 Tax=Drechslerella stenobrocha 248 TaxID=1043628 RepID=W7I579_9PEZI|nr:hypothetical protein DRE_01262 [Drechslerella stenobrocha 248]
MSHTPHRLELSTNARAPRDEDDFQKSIQDHGTKYRLRQLTSGSFFVAKIPRSERPPKPHLAPKQRMQGFRKETAEDSIRRVKRQATRKACSITVKTHRAIRHSQELRQRILHARDETVDLLIPLFEELGTEPDAVFEARRLARRLDKKIGWIEGKIARTERKIITYQTKISNINTAKEAKVAVYETQIRNLTRRPQIGVTAGGEENATTAGTLRKGAELWLHTRLNRHTRSCTTFDRPLHRSKSQRASSEGVRVRWSGDLSLDDSVTIRPTQSGASGEISRSTSTDSLQTAIVNIDAVVALPADAVEEGLELDLRIVKRAPHQRQFDPQDPPVLPQNEGPGETDAEESIDNASESQTEANKASEAESKEPLALSTGIELIARTEEKPEGSSGGTPIDEVALSGHQDLEAMIRQTWSIRIEAPKPPPQLPPPSTASKVAQWAGIPHYRLPRFNLADEALLQELQVEDLDEEDYLLLPSPSSTVKDSKPPQEAQFSSISDRQGPSDRPKPEGGKLRKPKPSKQSQPTASLQTAPPVAPEIAPEKSKLPDSKAVEGDIHKFVPADFDSTSSDYPRHPRTPDRYLTSLSRGSSQRERRNSLSSTSDWPGDYSSDDRVKAPVAVRKSPPQFLQHWDDSNPYYYSRPYETEHLYTARSRPTNRTLSISSSSRLPILHESHQELSCDESRGLPRAQTMPSSVHAASLDVLHRQRRSKFAAEAERNETLVDSSAHPHSSNAVAQSQTGLLALPEDPPPSSYSATDYQPTAMTSPDEPALTEMSTEILIAGQRTEKRSHPQPNLSIEEWVRRVGTPAKPSGTPKTMPSMDVEVATENEGAVKREAFDVDKIFLTSPMHAEISNPEVPLPVPTRTSPESFSRLPLVQDKGELTGLPPPPQTSMATLAVPQTEAVDMGYGWPNVEETGRAEPQVNQSQTAYVTPATPVTVAQITPPERPPPPPPSRQEERQHSPLSGPIVTFTIDPRTAEKRRMTVAFGITPLQRRETAELAQEVLRRVSSVGSRRGSLASVIRVVDTLLVKEREEQLRRSRRAEMAWD